MKTERRQKLAREPFAEKLRKLAQLIRLAKTFPRRPRCPAVRHCFTGRGVEGME
jgi:hypothetical protein